MEAPIFGARVNYIGYELPGTKGPGAETCGRQSSTTLPALPMADSSGNVHSAEPATPSLMLRAKLDRSRDTQQWQLASRYIFCTQSSRGSFERASSVGPLSTV